MRFDQCQNTSNIFRNFLGRDFFYIGKFDMTIAFLPKCVVKRLNANYSPLKI